MKSNSWYLKVFQKVNDAKWLYDSLKKERYTTENLNKMEECRAIMSVWGDELRRLELVQ